MDLIADLIGKRLTEDEADRVLERLQDADRTDEIDDWGTAAGMSWAESHAITHGAKLREVARWRASGWPIFCCLCGGALDYLTDDWMVRFAGASQSAVLLHLVCPQPPLPEPACPTHPDVTMYSSVFDDARFMSASHELESVLRRMADGELEAWQVIGFLESVYVDAVSQATVDAYEQVYGRSPKRPPDDESPST